MMVSSSANAAACLRAAVILIGAILVAMPIAAGESQERIGFAYKNIDFNTVNARAMFEADFRRAITQRGLKVSSDEVAGAAAAAVGGVEHTDTWDDQQIIRGCGPAKQLCFEIVCERCTGGR